MRPTQAALFTIILLAVVSMTVVITNLNKTEDSAAAAAATAEPSLEALVEATRVENLQSEIRLLNSQISVLESRIAEYNIQRLRSRRPHPPTRKISPSLQKRILVTGGAGFVGSHLVDRLMRDGHNVIVADNFDTGRIENIEHWLGHRSFELLHHDIVEPLFLKVDQIYHLASPASPPHYMKNAIKTIKVNTLGTLNMLGLAKRVGARFLLASTSEVYGDPEVHPQSESYWGNVNSIGPRSCYDESKRLAESLTYAYAKQNKLDVRVARIFNTYGPRMHVHDGRVVSNFIIQALKGESLTVYGSGTQTRSFQYISDLVEGLVRLMENNYTKPVNLGNPDEYTINKFAEIIIQDVGVAQSDEHPQLDEDVPLNTSILYGPLVEDDPRRRRPDINLAQQILKWQPNVKLSDGLRLTINYFMQELKKQL